jgi:hypothetical protein
MAMAPKPAAESRQSMAPTRPMLATPIVHVHRANLHAIVKPV